MLTLSLSAGAFAGGCGGADHLSKSEYEKRFRAATQEALTAGEKNGTAGAGPAAQRVARDVRAAAIVRGLASRLEGLDAPNDVKGAQGDLIAGLRGQASEIEQAVAAHRKGNAKPLDALERRGGPSRDIAEREQHALEEFKEKGYSVANAD